MRSVQVLNKRSRTVVDLPTQVRASLFAPLMFAKLKNHSPLITLARPTVRLKHLIVGQKD